MASFADIKIEVDGSTVGGMTPFFTDRVEPQEAFVRKINTFYNYRKTASGVLAYYGIGGIGKTTLKNRFCQILRRNIELPKRISNEIKADYVTFDFGEAGVATDKMTILSRLRNQLVQKDSGYKFYLFDLAMLIYSQKIGVDITEDKSTSLILSQNAWLSGIVTGLGAIPLFGSVSNILQGLDALVGSAIVAAQERKIKEKYAEEIREMCQLEADEMLQNMHRYFIIDMQENMLFRVDNILVVFLDTYEKYTDIFSTNAVKTQNDDWLRKDSACVIKNIPGILWVILGREKLHWAEDDPYWESDLPERPYGELSDAEKDVLANEIMEQHLLGDLSEKDALAYLQKAGLQDPGLGKQIYDITNGTPLFLDICVKQYNNLVKYKEVTIDDFGRNVDEMIARYFQNMPIFYQDLSMVLSVVGSWNDALVEAIIPQLGFVKSYTKKRYETYLNHSFIIRSEDNHYYIHESVRVAFYSQVDENMRKEIYQIMAAYYLEKVKNAQGNKLCEYLLKYLQACFHCNLDCGQLYAAWIAVYERIKYIRMVAAVSQYRLLAETSYNYVKVHYPGSEFERYLLAVYCDAIGGEGRMSDLHSLMENEDIVENWQKEIDYCGYCEMLCNFSYSYIKLGKYDLAEKLMLSVLENVLDDAIEGDQKLYLHVLEVYCYILFQDESRIQEYLTFATKLYELCVGKYGEDDYNTIKTLHYLAIAYYRIGEKEKALEIGQKAYDKNRQKLGLENRNTINTLSNVLTYLRGVQQYDKAIALIPELTRISESCYGEKHPGALQINEVIARVYKDSGDYAKAVSLLQEVYEKRKEVLGETHPETKDTYALLLSCKEKMA